MSDPEAVLEYVAAVLTDCRHRFTAAGLPWPVDLESARLLACSGQGRPNPLGDNGSRDDRTMVVALDYEQVASRLSVSARTVRRIVASGELPAIDVGGCPRIRVDDLAAWVAGRPVLPVKGRAA